MKSSKRSQTINVVSYVKVDVPGQQSELHKVVKKRKIRKMSSRRFNEWADGQSKNQSANRMGIVDERGDSEADSWQQLSIKSQVSSK